MSNSIVTGGGGCKGFPPHQIFFLRYLIIMYLSTHYSKIIFKFYYDEVLNKN